MRGDSIIPRELLRRVRRIEIAARRRVTSRLAGGYRSAFRGQGMEFEDVRPYQAGDDVRAIDWNVTARTGQAHVKRFVVERETAVVAVVDISASVGFGSGPRSKQEVAAELCALMAFVAVGNQDRVGLVLAADTVRAVVPPGKGRRHLYRVIRELLRTPPPTPGTATGLAGALETAVRVVPRHSVLLLVSDFQLDAAARAAFDQALGRAARRHDVIAVCVTDPAESELPPVGLVSVADPESGAVALVDTASPRVRQTYAAEYAARQREVRRLFTRHRVDRVDLSTTAPYVEDLLRFFHTRARRLR
ncbi:MAG: DUF58 domain-containing protein [Nitrospirota bacterium]|nr:DUF58 domain-containing protein [Nitrospirota bacterium]